MTCIFCGVPVTRQNKLPLHLHEKGKRVHACTKAECIIKAYKLPTQATALQRRSSRLQSTYGLTHNDYLKMLEQQNGGCAICGSQPLRGQHLAVDHDHNSGRVRGLLCTRCNLQLGWYENRKRAITAYLRKYKIIPVR